MTWLMLWCHRHTAIAGFTGAVGFDGTVILLVLNAQRIGRCAARLGRLVARAYVNDPPVKQARLVEPVDLYHAAVRRAMDERAGRLVAETNWRELDAQIDWGVQR
jgi:hypothetical protein